MKFRTAVGLCGALAGLSGAAHAAEAPVPRYTLEDCIQSALTRDGGRQNALRDEEIGAARIAQVRAQVLPDLKARGAYTRLEKQDPMVFGGQTFAATPDEQWSAGLDAEQLLYSGGSVDAALRAARIYREEKALARRQAEARLRRDVRLAYYDLALAQRARDVRAASLEQLENLVRQAEQKFAARAISEYDLLSARVRAGNERTLYVAAERDLALARAALRDRARLPEERFTVADDLPYIPEAASLEDRLRQGVPAHWDAQRAERDIGLRQADVRATQGAYAPALRAVAGYGGQKPPALGFDDDGWQWGWSVGLKAEWSLWNGGRREAELREKRLELDKARTTREDVERAAALEIRAAWLDMAHAATALVAARETVGLAERGLEIARVRYDNGLATYLEFSDANLALSTARLAEWSARRDHLAARARLDYAVGSEE